MLCYSDLDMLVFLYELNGEGLICTPKTEAGIQHVERLVDTELMYQVNENYYTITPKGIHVLQLWPYYEVDAWAADEINELVDGLVDNPPKM